MNRIFPTTLLLALALGTPAFADDAPASAATAAVPAVKPDTELKSTVDALQADIRAKHTEYSANPQSFYKMVDTTVVPRFDPPYITQLVLGPNYRSATPEQRSRFTTAFKDMLIHAYADAMLQNYDSVKVDWLPVRMAPGATTATVNTKLQRSDGNQYAIGFLVHSVDKDWKIYDVTVEGISLVTSFKTQINAEIKKSSLDAVINKMEQGQLIKPKTESAK